MAQADHWWVIVTERSANNVRIKYSFRNNYHDCSLFSRDRLDSCVGSHNP